LQGIINAYVTGQVSFIPCVQKQDIGTDVITHTEKGAHTSHLSQTYTCSSFSSGIEL